MSCTLQQITVTFTQESIAYSVSYAHSGKLPTPGSARRTVRASEMARKGLQLALEGLDKGAAAPIWVGFGEGLREATDIVVIERAKRAG